MTRKYPDARMAAWAVLVVVMCGAAGAAFAGVPIDHAYPTPTYIYAEPSAELTAEPAAHRFAAEVDDATAAFVNPAGIGVIKGKNLFFSVAGDENDVDEMAIAAQIGVLAAAYRHRDFKQPLWGIELEQLDPTADPYRHANLDFYTLAAGVGPVWLRVGASFTRMTSDLSGDDASIWSAGLRSRPHPAISVGATVDRIDRPSFQFGELNTVYTYGLALHPIPGRPEILSLTAEGRHRDGDGRIDLAYGARFLSRHGFELTLLVRDDNGEDPVVGFGATVYLGRAGVEGGLRDVEPGDDMRWHGAVHLYDDHWRVARAPRERSGD
jgi:hypothetical protein